MVSFNSHEQFLAFIRNDFGARYRAPAGALFTVALLPVDGESFFFGTGKVVFLDEETPARGAFVYPAIALAEEWVEGVDQSIDRLGLLLAGEATIAKQAVRGRFGGTYGERNVHSFSRFTPWAEWNFRTAWHHEGPRPSLNNEPVVAFGLPPYETNRSAVSEWVYGRILAPGGDAPHMNALNTVIPDTRARLAEAKWDQEYVVVTVDANCDRKDLELHAVFSGSKKQRFESKRAPSPEVTMKVPEDTDGVWLSLIHSSGARMGETILNQAYRSMREEQDATPLEQQMRHDIDGGENERVEYKPFIKRGDQKEWEIVETVIAFANTQGGRLFLGVDDNRRLLGHGQMVAALPPIDNSHPPATRLRDWANKLLTDRCKPVPVFSVHLVEIDGDPVGVIDVKRGDQRPYCVQHRNLVFVRKGASNVIPDPKTEWAAFFGAVGVPGGIFGSEPF
jgi:Putative DNA-binding domain